MWMSIDYVNILHINTFRVHVLGLVFHHGIITLQTFRPHLTAHCQQQIINYLTIVTYVEY